jgi:hypothetical protein
LPCLPRRCRPVRTPGLTIGTRFERYAHQPSQEGGSRSPHWGVDFVVGLSKNIEWFLCDSKFSKVTSVHTYSLLDGRNMSVRRSQTLIRLKKCLPNMSPRLAFPTKVGGTSYKCRSIDLPRTETPRLYTFHRSLSLNLNASDDFLKFLAISNPPSVHLNDVMSDEWTFISCRSNSRLVPN